MKMLIKFMLLLFLVPCLYSTSQATELLDVKPIFTGGSVTVEVTADVSMTYTYYKVPGQARAVVDIADADPEKVEPLIVVNKGAVSSISVDKAQISGLVVSRLVFNLVAESDISVKHSPDRKQLTVTFAGSAAPGAMAVPPAKSAQPDAVPAPVVEKKKDAEPVKKAEPPARQPAAASTPAPRDDDDPLGLDESPTSTPKKESSPMPPAASQSSTKLAPVVPIAAGLHASSILKVVTGDKFIDIQANGQIGDFKELRLSKPERVVIDFSGIKSSSVTKTVAIKKFGISSVRVGVYPKYVRVVFDASGSEFPKYNITNRDNGLRISFK